MSVSLCPFHPTLHPDLRPPEGENFDALGIGVIIGAGIVHESPFVVRLSRYMKKAIRNSD
jgi:hypothetical protein